MLKLRKFLCIGLLVVSGAFVSPMLRSEPSNLRTAQILQGQTQWHPSPNPTIVIIADPEGTETTDFLLPHAILTASGAANVIAVAPNSGPVKLMPALTVTGLTTFDSFELQHPQGADIVVVPALHNPSSPAVIAFIQRQAAKGALIASVCEGAEVLANAGLLAGYRATSHFYALPRLARAFPETIWFRNIRYLRDRNRISSAGVSASIPVSLYLVSLIQSPAAANRLAKRLGIADWSSEHNSEAFGIDVRLKMQAAANVAAFWTHETLSIELKNGFDEATVALQADAWARSYRTHVVATGQADQALSSQGLRFITSASQLPALPLLDLPLDKVLPATLDEISNRYSRATARFVRVQLEFPN